MSATRCARSVVAALVHGGVRQVLLAPGSRSAPLAFALYGAAERGELELHVRIDERCAGFVALGLAKASQAPVAVVTTSGTAVANLWPAVLEASHSGIPLLVLSADRPSTMVHTGANQTTDQAKLFGDAVRAEARISGAEGTPDSWAFQVSRLVAVATGARTRDPGPVQLNVALADPLVPDDEPWPAVRPAYVEQVEPARDVTCLGGDRRTVVVAGDASPQVGRQAYALAEAGGVPLLAEPSSNARYGEALRTGRLLLGTSLAEQIERVILVGHPTLSRPVTRLLGRDDIELIVQASSARWADPGVRAARVLDRVALTAGDPAWAERWRRADRELSARLDGEIQATNGRGPTGLTVAASVLNSLGDNDRLVLGSSNPIRDVDLAPVPPHGPRTYANRGLAGIDGTISSAAGVALTEGPVTALMGDVTFLHDVGGLLVGPTERRPDLRIVVLNDDGGAIFATLEQGASRYAGPFERLFATPHGADLGALAAAYGVPFRRCLSLAELDESLRPPPRGIEVVEVRVRRDTRRQEAERLRTLAAELSS